MSSEAKRKKLIVIGGGFAGLNLIQSLKKAPIDILLIDKRNHHLFQPLLYQVATATLSPSDICVAFREVLANQENTTVLMGEVAQFNKDEKKIILENGDSFDYDYLAIAIGSKHSYFGHNEWESLAPGIKTITDALNIREHILTSFEKAERLDHTEETHKYLTFVIVGGGPTGVEFAGTIAELIKKTLRKNFRRIRTEKAKVYLIEAFDRILPSFHQKLSKKTKSDLEKMGVTVLVNHSVTNITSEGVQLGTTFIESKNVIWAAGNTIPTVVKSLGTELDKQGRVMVENDLSIPGYPEVFVLGDASHLISRRDSPLPSVATVALQQGKFLGSLLKSEIKLMEPSPLRIKGFKYFDKGSLATIGTGKAVCTIRKLDFSGLFAWLIWAFVHIAFLIGFRNRLSVLFEWTIHHLTGARSARIIHSTLDEKLPKHK
jgi:NADH dehydrogenase